MIHVLVPESSYVYTKTPLIWTPIDQKKVSVLSEVSLFKWLNCMQATVLEERIGVFLRASFQGCSLRDL